MSFLQKVVAVVDDDPHMRAAVARVLEAVGYGTETFESAEAILKVIATTKAICLVIDIQLGDITGVELARQLAANGVNHPIIFITGLNDETVRAQATAAGAVEFLRKPFSAKLLVDAVAKAIG